VRQGLRADHSNAALRWLMAAAIAALILSVSAAARPVSAGGGAWVALGYVAIGAASGYTVRLL
jgi:hypothetical protein